MIFSNFSLSRLTMRVAMLALWCAFGALLVYHPFVSWFTRDTKIIRVFTWADIFVPEIIEQFEKETGITVQMNYYASNEELLVKLTATRGAGYDLIVPSDYAVNFLRERNLLKKLDRTQLMFWNELNPLLLGHVCDPRNEYALPFSWEVFGIGYSKKYFAGISLTPSWDLLFKRPALPYTVVMSNDPLEAVQMASLYLYGTPTAYETHQQEITSILCMQREWVEAYAATRAHYFLATGNSPIAVGSSSYLLRAGSEFTDIGFLLPQEGAFVTIEHCALPREGKNEKYVYQFLNFLYSHQSRQQHMEELFIFPAITHDLTTDEQHPAVAQLLNLSRTEFKQLHFFMPVASEQQLYYVWATVKA